MAKLNQRDWTAIKWYMNRREYTIRDLMEGPYVIFRDKGGDRIKVNMEDIRQNYKAFKARRAKSK